MDNIINTFYIGNTNRFGFGTYNASSNNYKGILSNYNYPSNQNRSINTYFQKQNNNIRLPPISAKNPRIDFSNINSAEQLKPLSQKQFQNFDNYAFQNSYTKNVPNNQNFTPALIRMQYLEDKINNLEYKNKENIQNNINDIEEKYIGKDSRFKQFLDNHQNEVNNMYTNKLLNRLNEGNLYDFQYNPMLVRRKEVQNQLNILRNDLNNEEKYEKKKKRKKNIKIIMMKIMMTLMTTTLTSQKNCTTNPNSKNVLLYPRFQNQQQKVKIKTFLIIIETQVIYQTLS